MDNKFNEEMIESLKEDAKQIKKDLEGCVKNHQPEKYITNQKALKNTLELIQNLENPNHEILTDNVTINTTNSDSSIKSWGHIESEPIKDESITKSGKISINGKTRDMTDDEIDNFSKEFDKKMSAMDDAFEKQFELFSNIDKNLNEIATKFLNPFSDVKHFLDE